MRSRFRLLSKKSDHGSPLFRSDPDRAGSRIRLGLRLGVQRVTAIVTSDTEIPFSKGYMCMCICSSDLNTDSCSSTHIAFFAHE